MRILLLTLGAPGSGKSTFLKENNLSQYTLEPDLIRTMVQSPETNINGDLGISQNNDGYVWKMVFELLEKRMERGELTVIDATHSRSSLINRYRNLAKEYRYRVYMIDFRDVPLDTLLERNTQRDFKNVPLEAVRNIHARMQHNNIPSWVTVIKQEEISSVLDIKQDWSNYENVITIGDIHNSYNELRKMLDTIKSKVNPENSMLVFVGDYFDRGNKAPETLRLLNNIREEFPNTMLLTGNHERSLKHYKSWIKENKKRDKDKPDTEKYYQDWCRSNKLTPQHRRTFHSFIQADVTPQEVSKLSSKLAQIVYVKYGDKDLFINHAGQPNVPTTSTPTIEFIKGVGTYEDISTIQEAFINNSNNCIQVHGHRNPFGQDVKVNDYVYNINSDAEFGGYLNAVILNKDKKPEVIKIKSKQEFIPKNLSTTNDIEEENRDTLYNSMINHKGVKVNEVLPGIFSCNFSSRTFKMANWDNITSKARGLFIDKESNIIARGYDKFFNFNEMESTSKNAISRLSYPLQAYNKPNGFLGLLSVHNNEFFIVTKGSVTGPHVEMFKKQINPLLNNELKELIKSNNITLTFEVIDVLDDPHIVEYNKSKLILLNAIKNQIKYQEEPIDKYNKLLNVETIPKPFLINSFQEFMELKDKELTGIEGYVIKNNELTFKLKGNWYKKWKGFRGTKDYIAKHYTGVDLRSKKQMILEKQHSKDSIKFCVAIMDMIDNGVDVKDLNIIDLRRRLSII